MTFQQGLVYVIKETKDPLSGELKSVMDKIMLGVSTEKALFELAETHDLKELHLFSSALEITRDAGGNLSEVLKNIAKGMREKESSEKQIETLTAQSKLSGLIVGLLPVILLTLMYYMDKELVLPMFTTSLGLLLVLIAVCLELLGAVFIIKIINFNY